MNSTTQVPLQQTDLVSPTQGEYSVVALFLYSRHAAEPSKFLSPQDVPTDAAQQDQLRASTPGPMASARRSIGVQLTPQPSLAGMRTGSRSPRTSRHTPPGSPARRRSADDAQSSFSQIDLTLLDRQPLESGLAPFDFPKRPAPTRSQTDSGVLESQRPPQARTNGPFSLDSDIVASQRKSSHNGLPWHLSTSSLQVTESQPPSGLTDPASNIAGHDAFSYLKDTGSFDLSRQSSTADFDSFLGATKGGSTDAGSEAAFEPVATDSPGNGTPGDSAGGIPAPKAKKSHARKVSQDDLP